MWNYSVCMHILTYLIAFTLFLSSFNNSHFVGVDTVVMQPFLLRLILFAFGLASYFSAPLNTEQKYRFTLQLGFYQHLVSNVMKRGANLKTIGISEKGTCKSDFTSKTTNLPHASEFEEQKSGYVKMYAFNVHSELNF